MYKNFFSIDNSFSIRNAWNMKFNIFLLVFLCLSNLFAEELPESIPNTLSIEYYQSLGHAGRGFSMELKENNCKYSDKFINTSNDFSFRLSKEEWKELYHILRKNKVHKITTSSEMIHDYDGLSLSIQWENKSIQISQSGSRISSNWEKEWNAITSHLEKIRSNEYQKAVKSVEISLDKSLVGNFIHIQANSQGVVFRKYVELKNISEDKIQLKFLPGKHRIYAIQYEGYDPKKFEEAKANSMYPDNALNPYLETLKANHFTLTIETIQKGSFIIRMKDKKLVVN